MSMTADGAFFDAALVARNSEESGICVCFCCFFAMLKQEVFIHGLQQSPAYLGLSIFYYEGFLIQGNSCEAHDIYLFQSVKFQTLRTLNPLNSFHRLNNGLNPLIR